MTFNKRRMVRPGMAAWLSVYACAAFAVDCQDLGLVKASGAVMELREAAQGHESAVVYQDAQRQAWFIPLKSRSPGAGRFECTFNQLSYRKISATDPALQHDPDADRLSFVDTDHATHSIDARRSALRNSPTPLDSAGVNYQLTLGYSAERLNPGALSELYAYRQGWYLNTSLGIDRSGKLSRFESYALRESLDSGTYLRLGDATSFPTAQGEALQFAGVSWGTDRNLRPTDFNPVLPTLRNGNVVAGPLDVFINDSLQYQQNLQSGVYDVRNLPALQGFNSYRVRTLDAQGNPVVVEREIYLPAALLPPGIAAWRLEGGFQRRELFTSNSDYGTPFVAGNYSLGLDHDNTVGGQALVNRDIALASAGYDRRLTALWTGHLGLHLAKKNQQQGSALQARLDGGGRWWRLLADWTRSQRPLPGLSDQPALLMQRLIRAQWNGLAGWNFGAASVQSQRESEAKEGIVTMSATARIANSGTSVSLDVTRVRSSAGTARNVTVSLLMPLSLSNVRNHSVYVSQTNGDGFNFTRAQYNSSGQQARDASWGLGATYDARSSQTSMDGVWNGRTDKLELLASGRAVQGDISGLVALRSGVLWTGASMFITRPITGAFGMVSTGEKDVEVFYENRLVGKTDERGYLLVPDMLPLQENRISLSPANWPIHWVANQIEAQAIPPRGGGVLVSFKISAQTWPAQTMLTPLGPNGKRYPAGTVVYAQSGTDTLDTVIDRSGQLWISGLLPATAFYVVQAGVRCDFDIPPLEGGTEALLIQPSLCKENP